MTSTTLSTADQLRAMINGPIVAGVGATVDPGLVTSDHHIVPWSTERKIKVGIMENKVDGSVDIKINRGDKFMNVNPDWMPKIAMYNVDKIFGIERKLSNLKLIDDATMTNLRIDAIMIVFVNLCFGYYDTECREITEGERLAIESLEVPNDILGVATSSDKLNRAATFTFSRIHTKYQTNHAVGGNPAQGSIASSIRAFYGISSTAYRDTNRKQLIEAITKVINWATHPVHERLLLPLVIKGTGIKTANVHANGTEPNSIPLEEFFSIRSLTPPAGTHYFYVAASVVRMLSPISLMRYIPQPHRLNDMVEGLRPIA
ncbi:putative effector protein [Golovinomyces cichoracearum]|uniref:Putative effector protein n=1 Tax=Golovinomyces cichoracearum TaxID=62708 RepID=A0A420ID54_9PEZI|nr:putative effector protein [Golovinomyces cichoracearum]